MVKPLSRRRRRTIALCCVVSSLCSSALLLHHTGASSTRYTSLGVLTGLVVGGLLVGIMMLMKRRPGDFGSLGK